MKIINPASVFHTISERRQNQGPDGQDSAENKRSRANVIGRFIVIYRPHAAHPAQSAKIKDYPHSDRQNHPTPPVKRRQCVCFHGNRRGHAKTHARGKSVGYNWRWVIGNVYLMTMVWWKYFLYGIQQGCAYHVVISYEIMCEYFSDLWSFFAWEIIQLKLEIPICQELMWWSSWAAGEYTFGNILDVSDLWNSQNLWHLYWTSIYTQHIKDVRSCCGSVDKTMDSQSWGPQFESAGSVSNALGQGTLSSLPSPSERN